MPPSLCTHAFKLLADFPGGQEGQRDRRVSQLGAWSNLELLCSPAPDLVSPGQLGWKAHPEPASQVVGNMQEGVHRGPPCTLSRGNVMQLSLGT